jgi:type I restriction enzyme M protein
MTLNSSTIKSIQDIMRKDVGVDGDAQRIGQIAWLLFLKIFDDTEQEAEILDKNYKPVIPKRFRWSTWAADSEGITGDELLEFVNTELFPKLKNLQGTLESNPRAAVVRSVFEDAYNYMKSGTLLRQVINKISEIDFNSSDDRHLLGDIYEKILKDLQSAGNAGEFYTPRAVTDFMATILDPQMGEKILDPACGTGGFLISTIEHMRRKKYIKTAADNRRLPSLIMGFEKKQLPHLLCITNMMIHGVLSPVNIRHDNTLARPYKDWGPKERVDVIITNPPFGGVEEDGIEKNFPAEFRTRETADLFLALIIRLLKDGGRAAIVLPDGTLFGEGITARLKKKLLDECNLHTIARLPNSVFSPYTGIKTNLLFFTKGKPTKEVWYYEHPYPEGQSSYSKTKPMRFEEFEGEIKWWGSESNNFKKRVETEQAWKVSIDEIINRNYNLDIKNPNISEQISHDPEELLRQYAAQQQEIKKLRNQLKAILNEALMNGKKA